MRVILIDSQNIAHIVFHAMGQLSHTEMWTGVVFGFLSRVFALAEDLGTDKFVFCWDSRVSVRRKIFPEYKNRPRGSPHTLKDGTEIAFESLREQMKDLRINILPQLGFNNNIIYTGLEADDVIAMVIKSGNLPDLWTPADFIIVSGDKDLYQLLSDRVSIYNIKKKTLYTHWQFQKQYGISPEQWADAKAYAGCVSDTVPGIRGVADPAKSDASRILKYLRGESPGKHISAIIESDKSKAIYNRNIRLVKLPFARGLRPTIHENTFVEKEWLSLFNQYGFESFLTRKKLALIRKHFNLIRW